MTLILLPLHFMMISILLIALIAIGGMALTYVLFEDERMLFRLAAGNVIGAAIFGTAAFVTSSIAGFNILAISITLAATLLPLLLFRDPARRKLFAADRAKALGKIMGANANKAFRFVYYFLFVVIFAVFFSRAMWENDQGIFTGGSQNLGDLPFHLGVIFGFIDGNNFPPQNPSFAGARFSYPFIADFLSATFMRFGAKVDDAMFVQNVSWAFSLLVILERFVFKLTGDALAARIAPALLFFSGGLGFLTFFSDFASQSRGFLDFLWHIPTDYTIGKHFRWGNSMVVLFMTQRSLLLGMPLTLVVLCKLWKVFTAETPSRKETAGSTFSIRNFPVSIFLTGLLAGLLPLIHLHSLAVLFVVGLFLFVIQPQKWKQWLAFAAGVAVLAVPELLWTMAGSATETGKFFAWHFGWDKGQQNFFRFWFFNTGLFIPMAAAGMYLVWRQVGTARPQTDAEKPAPVVKRKAPRSVDEAIPLYPYPQLLILFSLPFVFLFVVSNAAKLAPWEWDNIKVLIYWFVGIIPFAALALA